jgi:hypothetical protein
MLSRFFGSVGQLTKRWDELKNYVVHVKEEKKLAQKGAPSSDVTTILAFSNEPVEQKPSAK